MVAAAAAAKWLQSYPTLCDPIDGSLPGSSIHGIFQARVLEWGAIAFIVNYSSQIIIIGIATGLSYVCVHVYCVYISFNVYFKWTSSQFYIHNTQQTYILTSKTLET